MRGSIAGVAPLRRELAARLAIALDLHDDGQHHRSPLGALVQEIRDAVVDRIFEGGWLREMLAGLGFGEAVQDLLLSLLHQLGCVVLSTNPFVTMSGPATTAPVRCSMVTTTRKMPSLP